MLNFLYLKALTPKSQVFRSWPHGSILVASSSSELLIIMAHKFMKYGSFSFLFRTKPTGIAQKPKQYLELTKKILEEAQWKSSMPPKFNRGQCEYLADKLKMAVDGAYKFLERLPTLPTMPEGRPEIFKLLYAMAKEAESFIEECCKDAWIQAAVKLTNMSEHVSAIGFNLALCAIVFKPDSRKWGARGISLSALLALVDQVNKDEVETVGKKASQDKKALMEIVEALSQSSKARREDRELASRLLKRLSTRRTVAAFLRSCREEFYERDITSVTLKVMLGKGAFATVYKAIWLRTEVAKKTIIGHNNPAFNREVSILAAVSHSNVHSLLCYGENNREQTIVTKLMDGDLFSLIHKIMQPNPSLDFPFTILVAVDIMLQVAEGTCYLHGMKIGHRDLKSHNVLVKRVHETTEYLLAEISDFGVSKIKDFSMTDFTPNIGTLRWKAPELIKPTGTKCQVKMPFHDVFSAVAKCDTYSFAMVCYEILVGKVPFSDMGLKELTEKVLAGERPDLPHWCPKQLKSLIEKCWSPDAGKRPNFGEICKELRYLKYELLMTFTWGVDWASTLNPKLRKDTHHQEDDRRSSNKSLEPRKHIKARL